MTEILKIFLQALFESLRAWIKEEEALTDKINALAADARAEGERRLRLQQRQIDEAAAKRPNITTGSQWNAGLLILLCLCFSGCVRYVYVPQPLPELPKPERPVLPDRPLTPTEQLLANYARSLENIMEAYHKATR